MIPRTVKGYISLMRRVERIIIRDLKGYEDLSAEDKEALELLSAEISNHVNEIET